MKICPQCLLDWDEFDFCPHCGEELIDDKEYYENLTRNQADDIRRDNELDTGND